MSETDVMSKVVGILSPYAKNSEALAHVAPAGSTGRISMFQDPQNAFITLPTPEELRARPAGPRPSAYNFGYPSGMGRLLAAHDTAHRVADDTAREVAGDTAKHTVKDHKENKRRVARALR